MLIPNDGVTEIIAHFIGYFQLSAEDARYRPELTPFARPQDTPPQDDPVDARDFHFQQGLQFRGFVPNVAYTPPPYPIHTQPLEHSVEFQQIPLALKLGKSITVSEFHYVTGGGYGPTQWQPIAPEPGSTILIASQIRYLMDDDVLVVGDLDVKPGPRTEVHVELESMLDRALAVSSGLTDLAELQSVTQLIGLVKYAPSAVGTIAASNFVDFNTFHVETADTISGFYSNGAKVDTQPKLETAFTAVENQPAMDADEEEAITDSLFIDASKTPTTMNISSGGNLSWNEVSILNAGLAPSVISVAGDYHRVDAIYQTNVLRDIDTVDAGWPAQNLTMGGNVLQNSAGFINHDQAAKSGAAAPANGFPQNWNVTTVDGDMIFLDWVQQYNFTLDNDTQILTAMGTNTYISSGLNLGLNSLSFANLGQYFDLVIIGGSLYDGNFITQTNVLLDSDKLSTLGNSTAHKGNAATGDNVLWNQASIENIGANNWVQDLPDYYQSAMDGFSRGDKAMPAGFSGDSALSGLGNLKVLYISGSVFDVHYINQTNVMGDADNLAIYEASLLKAQDSVWNVTTGSNTLVNKAKIVDYDSLGKTAYVGGKLYSDAVLVQADLLEGLGDRVTPRGNELANEVLAFLDDQTSLASRFEDHPAIKGMADHGISTDTFQSMFA